jgi:serine/threonine protein phosphatase PrpC
MEDSAVIAAHVLPEHHLFGVFDGHGGIEVAYYLRMHFTKILINLE